jgi:hypothetical protein
MTSTPQATPQQRRRSFIITPTWQSALAIIETGRFWFTERARNLLVYGGRLSVKKLLQSGADVFVAATKA